MRHRVSDHFRDEPPMKRYVVRALTPYNTVFTDTVYAHSIDAARAIVSAMSGTAALIQVDRAPDYTKID